MRTRGSRTLDPVAETVQIDWLVVSSAFCRDQVMEQRLMASHFRKPHEPWGGDRAFVHPVEVRRSRRRVLFLQHSGIEH